MKALRFNTKTFVQRPAKATHRRLFVRPDCALRQRGDELCKLHRARQALTFGNDLVRETMANMSKRLLGADFARTHRSYIVNVDRVSEIRGSGSGRYDIVLRDGQSIPLSRGYRDAFKALIG